MATLTYYTFSKRHKSTLQPTSGTDINVDIKDGCNMIAPVFLLQWDGRPSFNYCQYEGRFYFVTDIRYVRTNLWEIECEEDYLASWKTDIGNTSAMILYASGGSDDIIDTRIPLLSGVTINRSFEALNGITITDGNQGTIILSITGTGSFGNYVMQSSNLIFELMRDMDNWMQFMIQDPITGLQQLAGSGAAPDNLKGAIALPILASSMTSGALEDLYLGNYPCVDYNDHPIKGYRITDPLATGAANLSIPWKHSGWRRHAPYSQLYLYLPLIGTMQLPVDELINESSIDILYGVNITSGDVAVEVRAHSSQKIITTASGNCAMATPYGSANISSAKVGSAIVTGIGGIIGAAALTTPVGRAAALFAGLSASAGQMLSASHGETKGGGGLSGGASHGLSKLCVLSCVSKDLTDDPSDLNDIMGKPLMQKALLGSYSGFIQTDGAQISGNMLNSEREVINSLLDGGIYYE